ncbi:hypothetical protein lpa_04207 [Legionella pneumophila 2300/99 Alcoy]|nr:hypothetical protein lpa_04207 [Legionella pneumophila 2300/99 Alcoy]
MQELPLNLRIPVGDRTKSSLNKEGFSSYVSKSSYSITVFNRFNLSNVPEVFLDKI